MITFKCGIENAIEDTASTFYHCKRSTFLCVFYVEVLTNLA